MTTKGRDNRQTYCHPVAAHDQHVDCVEFRRILFSPRPFICKRKKKNKSCSSHGSCKKKLEIHTPEIVFDQDIEEMLCTFQKMGPTEYRV